MAKQYWLMKSEPDVYSFDDLVAEANVYAATIERLLLG